MELRCCKKLQASALAGLKSSGMGFAAVAESFRDSQRNLMDSFEIHFAAMLSLPWSRAAPPCKPVKRPSVALKSVGLALASQSVCFARTTEILLIECWKRVMCAATNTRLRNEPFERSRACNYSAQFGVCAGILVI